MAIDIVVPRLGWSMEEGKFAGWLKQDGEPVERRDALFLIEGDKATDEVESLDAGILRIPPDAPKEGDTVTVGQLLGYLVEEGEAMPTTTGPTAPSTSVDDASATPTTVDTVPSVAKPTIDRSGARTISPRAARLAAQLGIDWLRLKGTGRGGRVRERDVLEARTEDGSV